MKASEEGGLDEDKLKSGKNKDGSMLKTDEKPAGTIANSTVQAFNARHI